MGIWGRNRQFRSIYVGVWEQVQSRNSTFLIIKKRFYYNLNSTKILII